MTETEGILPGTAFHTNDMHTWAWSSGSWSWSGPGADDDPRCACLLNPGMLCGLHYGWDPFRRLIDLAIRRQAYADWRQHLEAEAYD